MTVHVARNKSIQFLQGEFSRVEHFRLENYSKWQADCPHLSIAPLPLFQAIVATKMGEPLLLQVIHLCVLVVLGKMDGPRV